MGTSDIYNNPFRVGRMVYARLDEAMAKAQYASEIYPETLVTVWDRKFDRPLASFLAGRRQG